MKAGDLVRIVQSPIDDLTPSYLGEIGMIVSSFPSPSQTISKRREYDKWYEVSVHGDKLHRFRIDYLEVVSESR